MDQTHLHLLITHLPIFGAILGALVLAYGILTKSTQTQVAAYFVFIISSVGAGIAYITGEAAEETAEKIPGIAEKLIEQHEEFALIALVSLIILGVVSIVAWFINYRKTSLNGTTAVIVLFIAFISFGLVARTGYLGGQIRHTEVHSKQVLQQGQGQEQKQEQEEEGKDDE